MATSNQGFRFADGKLQRTDVALKPLNANQVRVKITHSGFCATDHAFLRSGMVLGHEGVGNVVEVGSNVATVKVGDRVGGGFFRGSCGRCKYCTTGRETWCYERDMYSESNHENGTFSDYWVAEDSFVYKIPENISSEEAAPLQCAGATVYAALVNAPLRSGDRVGIVGIGGLGHLAIQFAAKLGASVVVISSSRSKEEEARGFGATEFYTLDELDRLTAPIDLLIFSASGLPDFDKYFKKEILARDATVIPLSAGQSVSYNSVALLFNGYTIKSSLVAGRKVHNDMLEFAARNGVHPALEIFPWTVDGFQSAVERMEAGKLRYRAVLKHD